ncbi:hypothetical protein CBP36_20220 (plasmid) [Acidovorax carolinensis]|uniref:Uncharacterized protein n=1 Tax=Acidovorax carolinensis TaxID=553814 RepID=A0A240UJR6_9BURK|nr:hypothetical protein CBP36_20220 [Acidovorax carolinensis]
MILTGYSHSGWSRNFSYDGLRLLADFDKVFAMLDGVTPPRMVWRTCFAIISKSSSRRNVCPAHILMSATTQVWAPSISSRLALI